MGSPLRVRGKVLQNLISQGIVGITPAYAGKRDAERCAAAVTLDHPRACGEKAANFRAECGPKGSPPRMRGKGDCPSNRRFAVGITPACAGKRIKLRKRHSICGDHPRVCEEKNFLLLMTSRRSGSPPRVRGKDALV